jgi:hypothetical protein
LFSSSSPADNIKGQASIAPFRYPPFLPYHCRLVATQRVTGDGRTCVVLLLEARAMSEQNALVSAGGAQANSSEHTPSVSEYFTTHPFPGRPFPVNLTLVEP